MRTGELQTIVVLNSKGGCGKTTLATTLAAAFAQRGVSPTLADCDPEGYSLRWVDKRPVDRPPVYAVAAFGEALAAEPLRSHVRLDSPVAIIDLPAAIPHRDLHDFIYLADRVLIPIVPSEIDVHSASRLIAELLLDAQLDRSEQKLAIVANRVRSATRSYRQLCAFLASLRIPMIAALRDTQNFVYAAGQGLGITELPAYAVRDELVQVNAIMAWLERRDADRADWPLPAQGDAEPAELDALH
jgi:chromosome partitioning protein